MILDQILKSDPNLRRVSNSSCHVAIVAREGPYQMPKEPGTLVDFVEISFVSPAFHENLSMLRGIETMLRVSARASILRRGH